MKARSIAAAGALLLGACTVSTNEEPVAIGDPFGFTEATTTTSTTPDAVTKVATVWFLETLDTGLQLAPVEREVDVAADVQEILGNLFSVRPDGEERPDETGLTSAIPESAVLLSATPATPTSSRLIVDVRGLFGSEGIQGNDLRNALAQIVWTATEDSDIDEVSFRNDGAQVDAIVGSGQISEGPVDRADYRNLA